MDSSFLPLIITAVGGIILGPGLSRLLGGSSVGGIVGGVLGALAAHYGLDAADIQVLGNGDDPASTMNVINAFLEGGAGGGVMGIILGALMKRR